MSLECSSRSHDLQLCRKTIPDARCSDRERCVPDLSSCPPHDEIAAAWRSWWISSSGSWPKSSHRTLVDRYPVFLFDFRLFGCEDLMENVASRVSKPENLLATDCKSRRGRGNNTQHDSSMLSHVGYLWFAAFAFLFDCLNWNTVLKRRTYFDSIYILNDATLPNVWSWFKTYHCTMHLANPITGLNVR